MLALNVRVHSFPVAFRAPALVHATPETAFKITTMKVHNPTHWANAARARNSIFSFTLAACMDSTSDALHKRITMLAVETLPNGWPVLIPIPVQQHVPGLRNQTDWRQMVRRANPSAPMPTVTKKMLNARVLYNFIA